MSHTENSTRRGILQIFSFTLKLNTYLSLTHNCIGQSSLPADIGFQPDFSGPLPRTDDRGTKPAELVEMLTAKMIVDKSPIVGVPFDVARFFLDVANGRYGVDWVNYTKGWPVRWNPLIVEFFEATRTRPMGDVTPWCAAFVNWCILRATKKSATKNASSGSFRTFGKLTNDPRPGDLVVFKSADPTLASAGRGHVGFFVRGEKDRVLVLGGNQIRQGNHMINETWFTKKGRQLVLDSYRTDQVLHG